MAGNYEVVDHITPHLTILSWILLSHAFELSCYHEKVRSYYNSPHPVVGSSNNKIEML